MWPKTENSDTFKDNITLKVINGITTISGNKFHI